MVILVVPQSLWNVLLVDRLKGIVITFQLETGHTDTNGYR